MTPPNPDSGDELLPPPVIRGNNPEEPSDSSDSSDSNDNENYDGDDDRAPTPDPNRFDPNYNDEEELEEDRQSPPHSHQPTPVERPSAPPSKQDYGHHTPFGSPRRTPGDPDDNLDNLNLNIDQLLGYLNRNNPNPDMNNQDGGQGGNPPPANPFNDAQFTT